MTKVTNLSPHQSHMAYFKVTKIRDIGMDWGFCVTFQNMSPCIILKNNSAFLHFLKLTLFPEKFANSFFEARLKIYFINFQFYG